MAYSKGRLTSVTSTVSTYGYDEYDALGRVRRSSQVTGGTQYSMSYGYNLADDVGESRNVTAEHPDVVERLMLIVEQARADLGDSLTNRPGANRRPAGRLK